MNVTLTDEGYTLDGKWRLVPVEPTDAMTEAAFISEAVINPVGRSYQDTAQASYTAMIKAAPNPPQSLSLWQPIATAPSKTPIIVGPTKRMGICVAELDEHGYWYVDAPDGFHSLYTPTHWMPLPEPAP